MKTKFTKVAVSERLPEKQGYYFTNNGYKYFFNNGIIGFTDKTEWFLEESPDREDEMIEMLEELVELKRIKDLDGKTPEYQERQPKAWEKAKSLLQSLK